jgi:subtilisin family serine protease
VGAVGPGHDFLDGDGDVADVNGHGTAVAGVAAARANNGLGAAGACWACRLMPLRVLRPDGFAQLSTIAGAIDYAVANGAAVVNVSLYGESRNGAVEAAVRRAYRSGVKAGRRPHIPRHIRRRSRSLRPTRAGGSPTTRAAGTG